MALSVYPAWRTGRIPNEGLRFLAPLGGVAGGLPYDQSAAMWSGCLDAMECIPVGGVIAAVMNGAPEAGLWVRCVVRE